MKSSLSRRTPNSISDRKKETSIRSDLVRREPLLLCSAPIYVSEPNAADADAQRKADPTPTRCSVANTRQRRTRTPARLLGHSRNAPPFTFSARILPPCKSLAKNRRLRARAPVSDRDDPPVSRWNRRNSPFGQTSADKGDPCRFFNLYPIPLCPTPPPLFSPLLLFSSLPFFSPLF